MYVFSCAGDHAKSFYAHIQHKVLVIEIIRGEIFRSVYGKYQYCDNIKYHTQSKAYTLIDEAVILFIGVTDESFLYGYGD